MSNIKNGARALLLASLATLVTIGCGGDDSVSSPATLDPTRAPATPPAGAGLSPAAGSDSLAAQWNRQEIKVTHCPAYKDAPSAEQMARWGWNIVELQGSGEPEAESEEVENPASPTGSTRFSRLRFEAQVVRASGKLGSRRVLRYTTHRAASAPGVAVRAEASDLLDGRPGRAPLAAEGRTFAIVFPDPYKPEDLVVSATFASESDLVRAVSAGAGTGTFDELATAIEEARKAALEPVLTDDVNP